VECNIIGRPEGRQRREELEVLISLLHFDRQEGDKGASRSSVRQLPKDLFFIGGPMMTERGNETIIRQGQKICYHHEVHFLFVKNNKAR